MKPAPDAARRRGHAFGLALDAGYEIPGTAGRAPRGARPVRLELTRALAPGRKAHRIAETGGISVDHDEDGYLIRAPAHGAIRVDPSGAVVVTALGPDADPERWQMLLVGQGLPLAAVLRGLEPLHASAVVMGGRAVALAGPPGGGKSSLAAALVARGATFLTDDVLAVESSGGTGLLAYPGPSRPGLDRHPDPVELAAVCLLQRRAAGARARAAPLEAPDPRDLLGTTFNAFVSEPARSERHLEVSARLATGTVLRADVPEDAPIEQMAATIASAIERL